MTEEQKNLVQHLIYIETFWTEETVSYWKGHAKAGPILNELTVSQVYNEGLRFRDEANEKIGVVIY